jgi:hypothetical protein
MEHKYNLTQGLLEKLKLAQYVYEKGHIICLEEVKVLQIAPNTTYSKIPGICPLSQSSFDISPSRTPIITVEVKNLQHCPM